MTIRNYVLPVLRPQSGHVFCCTRYNTVSFHFFESTLLNVAYAGAEKDVIAVCFCCDVNVEGLRRWYRTGNAWAHHVRMRRGHSSAPTA